MTDRPTFDLQVSQQAGIHVFNLSGRLMDQQQADRLMEGLDDALAGEEHRVVLDLSQLQYMNSTGLNILINLLTRTRNAGGDVVIAGVSASHMPVSQTSASSARVARLDSSRTSSPRTPARSSTCSVRLRRSGRS